MSFKRLDARPVTQRYFRAEVDMPYVLRMTHCDPYPTSTRPERIADGVMHGVGVMFAALGGAMLIAWASGQADMATVTSLWIYTLAMTASFVASTCYHFTPWERARPTLRRLDHAAIYLKIAGTYTPLVVLIGSGFAYGVLAVVWGLAAIGVMVKLFFWSMPGRFDLGLYLGMGWLSVVLLTSLIGLVPLLAIGLIVAGGVVYSAGAVVFSAQDLRFQNAIWHGFVLVASLCFFAAIALGVMAAA